MHNKCSLFAAVMLVSAAPLAQPAQAGTFASNNGYQISTPGGWVTKPGPHDSKVTTVFYCATGKNGQPNFPMVEVASRPVEVMTMKKLVSYAPWMVSGTFPKFHATSETYTSLDGVSALDIKGTYPRGSRTVYVRELFTIRGGEAYIITMAYPAEKRAVCEAVGNEVISSIRWR